MNIQLITVPAEIIGEHFVFLDDQGNELISRKIHRKRIADVLDGWGRIVWNVAIRKAVNKINRKNNIVQTQTPWQKKSESLAKSFLLRSRELKVPKTRKRFERYPTTTWKMAIKRMIHQARNCYRYNCESPWNRWLINVCKNNNRRSMARYGKNNQDS